MNWNDVAAALRAGACAEDVLTHLRQASSATSGSGSGRAGGTDRAPGDGASSPRGVERLYVNGMGQSLQLCYLHTPLHVLELLDGDGCGRRVDRAEHFDGELSFDVLDGFSPRLVGCVPAESLGVLSRARRSAAKATKKRARRASAPTDAAALYASYRRGGTSGADAAISALREAPSSELASYIAGEVLPTLAASEQGKVASACRVAVGGGRLNSSALRSAVETQTDALQAVKVLDALLGVGIV